jgi:hypothetical protein
MRSPARTAGTNTATRGPPDRWISALLVCALLNEIGDAAQRRRGAVHRRFGSSTAPRRSALPATTASPGRLGRGSGSPVTTASSTSDRPSTTTRPRRMRSPGTDHDAVAADESRRWHRHRMPARAHRRARAVIRLQLEQFAHGGTGAWRWPAIRASARAR